MLFSDNVDRTNFVSNPDGSRVWVAPASLAKHGLRNGQQLAKDEWQKVCWLLAAEWTEYVQSKD